MDNLVKSSLEERGINGHYRFHSPSGQSRGQRHGVLLRYSHIENLFGKRCLNSVKPVPSGIPL